MKTAKRHNDDEFKDDGRRDDVKDNIIDDDEDGEGINRIRNNNALLFPPPESWFRGDEGRERKNRHLCDDARDGDNGDDDRGREECCYDDSLLLPQRPTTTSPNGRGVARLFDDQERQQQQQQQQQQQRSLQQRLPSDQQSQRRQRKNPHVHAEDRKFSKTTTMTEMPTITVDPKRPSLKIMAATAETTTIFTANAVTMATPNINLTTTTNNNNNNNGTGRATYYNNATHTILSTFLTRSLPALLNEISSSATVRSAHVARTIHSSLCNNSHHLRELPTVVMGGIVGRRRRRRQQQRTDRFGGTNSDMGESNIRGYRLPNDIDGMIIDSKSISYVRRRSRRRHCCHTRKGGGKNESHGVGNDNNNNIYNNNDYDDTDDDIDDDDDDDDDSSEYYDPIRESGTKNIVSTTTTTNTNFDQFHLRTNGIKEEVRFTTLPWIERQLVKEWRTYDWDDSSSSSSKVITPPSMDEDDEVEKGRKGHRSLVFEKDFNNNNNNNNNIDDTSDEDVDDNSIAMNDDDELLFNVACTMAPRPLPKPQWEHATSCYACRRNFGPTLHRHHCRRCGHSYCRVHSNYTHKLSHLGYDGNVPERVCTTCKVILDNRDLEERILWRLARCRDYFAGDLTPYFETGVDTIEDAAYRLARMAIKLARKIPLGAQAYVAIETAEVLRKHGLKGVYGLLLRKEFLAAADLLCRVCGINKQSWPLSVHELSAAIFYALAQHRALRGLRPEGEELIHTLRFCNEDGGSGVDAAVANPSLPTVEEGRFVISAPPPAIILENVVIEDVDDDDVDVADNVVWEGEFSDKLLDETDIYDPNSEKIIDVLAISGSPNPIDDSPSGRRKFVQGVLRTNRNIDDQHVKTDAYDTTPAKQDDKLPFDPVCEYVPDTLISSLLFYAPLALDFIYADCEVNMQLLAAQQGWRLVYASLDQNHHHVVDGNHLEGDDHFSDKPASAMFAHEERKIACLSIRGTATIQDVVTDIRATPVPFPQQEEEEEDGLYSPLDENEEWTSVFGGNGLALCGMAGAATNVFRETVDSLLYFALNGYKIRIVGHSLGGGVASLLGILVMRHFKKHCTELTKSSSEAMSIVEDGFVRVYSYGTPACVDSKLADHPRILGMCTSVVLHDDVVPRLTPTSVRGLLKHLLYIRETWVKAHLSDDLNAITERAYQIWTPRLRGSFTLLKKKGVASAKRLKKSCEKRIKGRTESSSLIQDYSMEYRNGDGLGSGSNVATQSDDDTDVIGDNGLDIEGELFYDATLNESDDESCDGNWDWQRMSNSGSNDVPFNEPPSDLSKDEINDHDALPNADLRNGADQQNIDYPQILEELPLPRMFIPGKIVHIYTHRGGYKAAFVPRKFRSLRRVSMAGNMLSDHMANKYYEGLLEVKAIRAAQQDLPFWVGFADDCTCACCASLFTWASTSNTEAQAARDKHNCRACGGLVCDPCSKKKIPIPSIGITVPVRVCDRCYNGWGTIHGEVDVLPCDRVPMNTHSLMNTKILEKKRASSSRRSAVVDELASRIPSISC